MTEVGDGFRGGGRLSTGFLAGGVGFERKHWQKELGSRLLRMVVMGVIWRDFVFSTVLGSGVRVVVFV